MHETVIDEMARSFAASTAAKKHGLARCEELLAFAKAHRPEAVKLFTEAVNLAVINAICASEAGKNRLNVKPVKDWMLEA